jgi:hypothetical protein
MSSTNNTLKITPPPPLLVSKVTNDYTFKANIFRCPVDAYFTLLTAAKEMYSLTFDPRY